MSSSVIPPKQDLPKEVWRVASTLSDEMQRAAVKKARQLGFDLTLGRIPLDETLINLKHNRDIILAAIETKKLVQLPLRLQYSLLSQLQKVADALSALVNGTDALLILEDAVDELTATVWQYNLNNLSSQVLGFETKMNQLKAQEILIQQVHREAEDFEGVTRQANSSVQQIGELHSTATEQVSRIQVSVDSSSALVAKAVEQEQRATAIMAQLQLADAASAQYGANAKNTAAELAATADRMRTVQSEIDNARSEFGSLSTNVRDLMSSVPQVIEELRRKADQSHADTEAALALLRTKLENSIQELTASSQGRLESAANALQSQSADTDSAVKLLIANTNDRLTQAETGHASRIDTEVSAFSQRVESLLGSLREQTNSELSDSKAKSDAMIADSSAEMRRLTSELAKLEEGIRASIERATGFSLFHSFQKRQLDIELAKRFWMYALAGTVVVSLCISAVFIWSLQFVTQYNAAFFLKLSISLPLVYAIAFCSIQYGRERRLEEEYAFKSSISISLDPYQRLVGQLVDRQKPEELAKYTAFVIESVGKVFTSPTDRIFDDQSGDKNTAEKIIKAVGDVIEPIVKAVRK